MLRTATSMDSAGRLSEKAPDAAARERRRQVCASAIAAVTLLALSVTVAACGGGGKSKLKGVAGHSEVRAEGVSTAGANPFTPAVGKDTSGVKPPKGAVGSGGGLPTYRANLAGLYGGTRNYATCDAHKLVYFLEHNPSKASAWATTLGIRITEIRRYVSKLTPVLLRTDTRVTNHGYVGGQANPIQSVLEAGTAVFVNNYGEPVIKCYCGNPLTPPVLYKEPTYTGTLWSGFSYTHITIIQQSITIIDTFTLFDPGTGMTFTRPAGTDGGSDGAYQQGGSNPGQPSQPSQPNQPTPAPSTTENPSASFSPSSGHQGDTFVLTASGFKPGANLDVTLTRPDGVVEHYSISAGGDGTGTYTFSNTGNVVTGTYSATVTNPSTGAQAHASVDVAPAGGP